MIDYISLKNWSFEVKVHECSPRDFILYALGCGVGTQPMLPGDLEYLFEKNLKVLPSMVATICTPGFWWRDPRTGVSWQSVLHAEQDVEFIQSMPLSGRVFGINRVTHVHDRGVGKGAVVSLERELKNDRGELLAVAKRIEVLRDDGGFSVKDGLHDPLPPRLERHSIPVTPCDFTWNSKIDPRAHYIFRLSGDPNPLHIDPEVANLAGFDQPIFHGLGLYGMTTHGLISHLVQGQTHRLKRLAVKFSAPTYPGEQLCFSVWRVTPIKYHFCVDSIDRNIRVLENGVAVFSEQ
jgi:acyl dehydratase